jgi:hypothetical protein
VLIACAFKYDARATDFQKLSRIHVLKTTLEAEINEDAWATLNSDESRPFPPQKPARNAVKAINHMGDEVIKLYGVG